MIAAVLMILLTVAGACPRRDSDPDYLDRSVTMSVNGIIITAVFFVHLFQYRTFTGIAWTPMVILCSRFGQLVVVTFLFFSGYGLMERISAEGDRYVRAIPLRRVLATWLRFLPAVILYLLAGWGQGHHFPVKKILLAFLGWESLGNSNWYIFVILCLWILTWLSFRLLGTGLAGHLLQTALAVGLILLLARTRDSYWYNTIGAFEAGLWFSVLRPRWDAWLPGHPVRWYVGAALCLGGGLLGAMTRDTIAGAELASVCACLLLVHLLRKVRIGNPVNHFLGQNLFGIYIMQRLPMILLDPVIADNGLYALVCAALTILLGFACSRLTGLLVSRLLPSS